MVKEQFIPISSVARVMEVATRMFDSMAKSYAESYTWATQLQKHELIVAASDRGLNELHTLSMLDDGDELRGHYAAAVRRIEETEKWALCEIGWFKNE